MEFIPEPLILICDSCGATAETWDFQSPDKHLVCDCCPIQHDHGGLGCRTITIQAKAHLTILDVNDLMEALGTPAVEPSRVLFLVHRMAGRERPPGRACP